MASTVNFAASDSTDATLAERFAEHISVPTGVIAEEVPGHVLPLFATKDVFDLENPAHVAAADSIPAALSPIQGVVGVPQVE